MAAGAEAACALRMRAAYWSVLIVMLAFGLLRLVILGNPLEGIALLVVGIPGGLTLLGMWAPTMRVWHVGGCMCWTAYCVFHVYKLARDPVSLDWLVYVGTGACTLFALAATAALAAGPALAAWRGRKGNNAGPLLPQHANAEALAADDFQSEAPSEPLVWPPPAHPLNSHVLPDGSSHTAAEQFANSERSAPQAAVWPPPGYTGN
ncbi:hypothetical protein KFE25_000295 [Diacronema lutheri]|uniref:Uncharacterized protein n=2 Tax=Diacronema lutheri TaxID=2081491 RepID=A0A8J5XHL2_DIALT|nr:hypothetical protein KFE25_000295 [Diacronema lutheri]